MVEDVVEFTVSSRPLAEPAWLVSVSGELDLYTAPRLQEELLELPGERTWLVVDLLRVTFLDSAGLSLLTTAARRLRYDGGGIVLAVADLNIERVLRLTGLDRYFEVRSTIEGAIGHATSRL
jgi:anti-sigma B factor antagonist